MNPIRVISLATLMLCIGLTADCEATEDEGLEELVIGYMSGDFAATVHTEWVSFEMVVHATVSNPTKASSPEIDKAFWRRSGDSMQIMYNYKQTSLTDASNGSGDYLFLLPVGYGYTIDSTKISVSTDPLQAGNAGGATWWDGVSAHGYDGNAFAYNSTALAVYISSSGNQPAPLVLRDINGYASYSARVISFNATVPIVGW